jgi:hypothetical protein
MALVGFEPTISAGERPQTYALDRDHWDWLMMAYRRIIYKTLMHLLNHPVH